MQELQFSGQVVNHMLWRQCICDDPNIMVFNFGGSGVRFTIQEFCLISGLFYGPVPTTHPTTSGHFRDTYFGGQKFPLHNHDIVEVFNTTTCEGDDDMVKLALLYFLETIILSKEKPTPIHVERVNMLDDIEYFLTYPWGTLSYDATVKLMRSYPGKRSNASHTYSITGFLIAFMVLWGYETIPSLAETFGIKSSLPRCPRMRNWTISGMPKKKILEDIFAGRGYEVVGVMVPKVQEMPLVAIVHHAGGQKPGDAAPVVEDESGVNLDVDRVHSVPDKDKTGTKKIDAVKRERRHALARQPSPIASPVNAAMPDAYDRYSSPAPRTSTKGNSVENRLCAMVERLSSIDSRQSSIDSRLSSIDSKLDCLIKLLGGTYNTTGVQLDEDADQCFDEVGVQDIGVGDAHRTCDQRTDHAANDIVGPMSISSSPIVESEHSVKWKMIRTLLVAGSVTFDPYRLVPDEVARQYTHFMDMSTDGQTVELFWITIGKNYFRDMECSPNWLTSDHMETVTHLIQQRADKYAKVFNSRILVLDNQLSIKNILIVVGSPIAFDMAIGHIIIPIECADTITTE
ncbi:hypothetical protein FNV43_RR10266 [Rhamnella rubrinervis]|uniref:DUF1985 domain-containing protein n=1 Tax=Rhamnella rubrinervis TaxID=2594499 RepID=A0A8K0HBI3_9ROSA|nr:hypothetical protein FNV43_RR10266 [Rhamnella rubrinervis]